MVKPFRAYLALLPALLAAQPIIETVAGRELPDNLPARETFLQSPTGLAVDVAGNLFVGTSGFSSDVTGEHRILKVDARTGIATAIGGNRFGFGGLGGDSGPATADAVRLWQPSGMALDAAGNVFFAERGNHRIRKIAAGTGILTTVAGAGPFPVAGGDSGDGGPATSARMNTPNDVAVDGAGSLYIADWFNHRVRRVDAVTGRISTIAGVGVEGYNGDGFPGSQLALASPRGVAVDRDGNVFIADNGNHRIRKVDAVTGILTTVAGTGQFFVIGGAFSGDGGPATRARLNGPTDVVVDSAGNLIIADPGNRRIRRVDARTGIISTVAGNGEPGFSGDGGPATAAALGGLMAVAADNARNLFILTGVVDVVNGVIAHDTIRIRRVDAATRIITTVAGGVATRLYRGEGGIATQAYLPGAERLAVDTAGNLFLTSGFLSQRGPGIRRLDALTGRITTVSPDGYLGLAVDHSGNLFFVDSAIYNRIRRLDAASGAVTTVAGDGQPAFRGDGGPATSASLSAPFDVAVDRLGNLYVADAANNGVRRVDAASGIITTVAFEQGQPTAVTVDDAGNVFGSAQESVEVAGLIGFRRRGGSG